MSGNLVMKSLYLRNSKDYQNIARNALRKDLRRRRRKREMRIRAIWIKWQLK